MAFTKITAAGIGSTETVTLDGLSVINNGSFGGNLTVGGVLTYEDVTNVDSVGVITARAGVLVGSGITLSKDGDVFFTGIATGNGSGLTNLPAANITGTLPAISGANLTNLDASDLASGTIPDARFPATLPAVSGANLTGLSGVSVANQGDNRVITNTGTTDALNAEANLTFALSSNDAILTITGANSAGHAQLTLQTGGTTDHCSVNFGDSDDDDRGEIRYTNSSDSMNFDTAATHRMTLDQNGYLLPATNNTYDLGSSSQRWRDVYTNDLNLSNEGSVNSVDGTWGSYTIQEGESDLFLINNRSGKKYKFNLTEVS